MATSYTPAAVLAVIVVIGVATFAIRGSFVALFGYLDEIPTGVRRALRFVPAAVLAALVVPSIVALDPGASGGAGLSLGSVEATRVLAGAVAAGVAWRTESVLATMCAGMGTLWLVGALL